jgi:hypothetical protein
MHARNAGLQRLRHVTRRVGIGAAVLTGVFAGIAAASNSGKHHPRVVARKPTLRRPVSARPVTRVPPAPSLPPLPADSGGGSAPAAPQSQPSSAPSVQPPAAPPAPAYSPPVVVSGGS